MSKNDCQEVSEKLLEDFSQYMTVNEYHNDDNDKNSNDDEWRRKCYGQHNYISTTFRNHLSDGFLQSSSGQAGEAAFEQFKIASTDILDTIQSRYICNNCSKSRRFFCYDCFTLSPELADHLPLISLPFRIDIIKHPNEVQGKSTAIHARVLAPNQVRIFTFPTLPDDWPTDNEKILLVFPSKNAVSVREYLKNKFAILKQNSEALNDYCSKLKSEISAIAPNELPNKLSDLSVFPWEQIVFIDSTWRQTKAILKHPRIKDLCTVVLDEQPTRFWRCDRTKRPITHLATIEAILYFYVQSHQYMSNLAESDPMFGILNTLFPPYIGQYDNLLFFFLHTFNTIRGRYNL